MIEYINKRMNEWAAWCKRREDGGLGYPSQSNYCSMLQIRGTALPGTVAKYVAEEEIEAVITRIRQKAPHQWDVAGWFYLRGSFTVKRIAQELKCDEATVYRRLHALHVAIMDGLNDLEIEAHDRAGAWHAGGATASSFAGNTPAPPVVTRRQGRELAVAA